MERLPSMVATMPVTIVSTFCFPDWPYEAQEIRVRINRESAIVINGAAAVHGDDHARHYRVDVLLPGLAVRGTGNKSKENGGNTEQPTPFFHVNPEPRMMLYGCR